MHAHAHAVGVNAFVRVRLEPKQDLQGLVRRHQDAVERALAEQRDWQAAVEGAQPLFPPHREPAVYYARVQAQLQPLLDHICRGDDGIVNHRRKCPTHEGFHWFRLTEFRAQQTPLGNFVGAEEADVRRNAASTDGEATSHEAPNAVLLQHCADSGTDARPRHARPQRSSLHPRLHGVYGVHRHVLHHSGTTTSSGVQPERRLSIPDLPLRRLNEVRRLPCELFLGR
mmetsp:Transcript_26593/g.58382  ORF Transcript_26593/g.58382 Transcript_26593/m.58382 type:complete len:227 (-) Transcript_26593:1064-1744(-)